MGTYSATPAGSRLRVRTAEHTRRVVVVVVDSEGGELARFDMNETQAEALGNRLRGAASRCRVKRAQRAAQTRARQRQIELWGKQ